MVEQIGNTFKFKFLFIFLLPDNVLVVHHSF